MFFKEPPMLIRRWTSLVMTLFLSTGLIACQQSVQHQGEGAGAVDTAAVRAALDSLRSEGEQAYREDDIGRVADSFHPELIYSPVASPPIRGPDSAVAFENQNMVLGATFDYEPIETRVLTDRWAYQLGTSTLRFTAEGAQEYQPLTATYLDVFRKTDDGWKVYRSVISSNELPGLAAPVDTR